MLVSDRSKVRLSLPAPRLTERFPVTSSMVTGPDWPLTVVPSAGVIVIWLAAGWLIVMLLEPLSVSVRLPSTRLAVTLAGVSRPSSDSRAGRERIGLRTGAPLHRLLEPSNLSMKCRTDICNLLVGVRTREPETGPRGSQAPAASTGDNRTEHPPARRSAAHSRLRSVTDGREVGTVEGRASGRRWPRAFQGPPGVTTRGRSSSRRR